MRFGRKRVPVLAEISGDPSPGAGVGALERDDLDAYEALLERLGRARMVLVTGDREGKGMAAAGLATAAAASGLRTVLVECDLANPTLAAALGLATAPGLTEYLRGEAEASQLLQPLVLAGPASVQATEPLICVVAGRPAPEAWGLLVSDGLRQALERLRSAYELAVVAGPPLRDEYSLAVLLAQVDATIACVRRSERRKLSVPVTGLVVRR